MKVYIAIDDTDSLEYGATGQTANQIMKMIAKKYGGKCDGLTRHQLLLHPDIPYTSHNSSMCFVAHIQPGQAEDLIRKIGEFLVEDSAPGSDPGFCFVMDDRVTERERLIRFGREAKQRVMTKAEGYALAASLNIHLSEHGGTGLGVIGALAGVGLRMTDNDGRFQGRLSIGMPGALISVEEILRESPVDRVQTLDGEVLGAGETVRLGEKLKTVLLDGCRTFLVFRPDGDTQWHSCLNRHIEQY